MDDDATTMIVEAIHQVADDVRELTNAVQALSMVVAVGMTRPSKHLAVDGPSAREAELSWQENMSRLIRYVSGGKARVEAETPYGPVTLYQGHGEAGTVEAGTVEAGTVDPIDDDRR